MKLKFLLPILGLLGTSGGLGAIINSVLTEGTPSNLQFIFGTGLVAALVGLVVKVFGDWRRAGGKFDGITTPAEARQYIKSLSEAFGLSPTLTAAAEELAPQAAELVTRLEARVLDTIPGATELIKLISQYEARNSEDTASDHNAVLWKCVDVLSKAITGNPLGEDLIAKFRDQLDLKLFPGTPTAATPVPLAPQASFPVAQ